MKNVLFHTLGCKLNYTETSSISEQFLKNNFNISGVEKPDIFVINTCSVTQNAERECRQIVRRIIKKHPYAFVVVFGCYAQMRAEEIANIPGVDLILGSKEKFDIFKYELAFVKYDKPKIFVSENIKEEQDAIIAESTTGSRTRAFLKIQEGCDYNCSYCTIPLARGNSRSVLLNVIVTKIKEIASKGFKEVVLTGVNVSDYGKNINSDFFELVQSVNEIEEIPRIRISSIEPNIITDKLIDFIAKSKRICHHFHIPMQSGDNEVLSSMQRRYRAEHFKDLVLKIKNRMPDAGLGLDVIVGFPTETSHMFENTYNLLVEIPFTYLHVFTYSPRPNTKASSFKRIVSSKETHERSDRLRNLSLKKKVDFFTEQLNKNYDVLLEEKSENGLLFGFTHNYIKVGLPVDNIFVNDIIRVKLIESKNDYCIGEKL